jgi:hypothetical protein
LSQAKRGSEQKQEPTPAASPTLRGEKEPKEEKELEPAKKKVTILLEL